MTLILILKLNIRLTVFILITPFHFNAIISKINFLAYFQIPLLLTVLFHMASVFPAVLLCTLCSSTHSSPALGLCSFMAYNVFTLSSMSFLFRHQCYGCEAIPMGWLYLPWSSISLCIDSSVLSLKPSVTVEVFVLSH